MHFKLTIVIASLFVVYSAIFAIPPHAKGKAKGHSKVKRRHMNPSKKLKDDVKRVRDSYESERNKLRETWENGIELDRSIEREQVEYLEQLLQKVKKSKKDKRANGSPKCVRKEYRSLTGQERENYHNAVLTLKNTKYGTTPKYDLLSELHHHELAPVAHFFPSFLPWHREYLFIYELALQEIDPSVCLPYWDSGIDGKLEDQSWDSAIFGAETLGNNWGYVTNGAFANFAPHRNCPHHTIMRFVNGDSGLLYSDVDFERFEQYTRYSHISYPNTYFENTHGDIHMYIQGHMGDLNCAVNDPIFFMHHCFVDYLWEKFRTYNQTADVTTDYPTNSALDQRYDYPYNEYLYAGTAMMPFGVFSEMDDRDLTFNINPGVKNIDGLDTYYTDYFYSYADAPSFINCTQNSDCGLKYVWCRNNLCVAQVREGGQCYYDRSVWQYRDESCFCDDSTSTPTCVSSICTCI